MLWSEALTRSCRSPSGLWRVVPVLGESPEAVGLRPLFGPAGWESGQCGQVREALVWDCTAVELRLGVALGGLLLISE